MHNGITKNRINFASMNKVSSFFLSVTGFISVLFLAFLLVLFSISKCNPNNRWSESRKKEFCKQCEEETDTIKSLRIVFCRFDDKQLDSVLIIDKRKESRWDSFYVYPENTQSRDWPEVWCHNQLFLKDTILLVVHGEKPFVLCHMKMAVWPQFTQFSEGYGCRLCKKQPTLPCRPILRHQYIGL